MGSARTVAGFAFKVRSRRTRIALHPMGRVDDVVDRRIVMAPEASLGSPLAIARGRRSGERFLG
jgi:hypothetical protein